MKSIAYLTIKVSFTALFMPCIVLSGCRILDESLVDVISPKQLTNTRLIGTRVRIQNYVSQNGRMPDAPSDLPVEVNKDCEMIDGWGNAFLWVKEGEEQVTVTSLGRDGKLGGVGEDKDLSVVYVLTRQEGQVEGVPKTSAITSGKELAKDQLGRQVDVVGELCVCREVDEPLLIIDGAAIALYGTIADGLKSTESGDRVQAKGVLGYYNSPFKGLEQGPTNRYCLELESVIQSK